MYSVLIVLILRFWLIKCKIPIKFSKVGYLIRIVELVTH